MIEDPLGALAVILGVAVLCQWLAATLRQPSVLFLLAAGVALSPVLDPDELFGELLFVGVGVGVAILLFEGGTGLEWRRLEAGRAAVVRLVTVGALIAWALGAGAAALVLDIDVGLAVLIGAILIVSGPTVVMPLLRVVRPREPTGSILRWEGILIDPIGAGVAIVVLETIIEDRSVEATIWGAATTFAAGLLVGLGVSVVIVVALQRRMIADHLQIPATLAGVVAAYAIANELRPEAGLLAATVLGMALANQRRAPAAHIAEFNENLGTTVLGSLFVVLGARVELDEVIEHLPASLVVMAVLVLLARPLTVLASTVGTDLGRRDRLFLMALAPRGVVAAAVASLFALELEHTDIDPGPLVPVVFTVVFGTVALAALTAGLAGRRLRVAQPEPNGVALVGGGMFAVELADVLNHQGVVTLHIGPDDDAADEAAQRGQLVYQDRLDTEHFPETLEKVGIATAVTLSGVDHLDAFASNRLAEVIGTASLFATADAVVEQEPGTARAVQPRPVLPPGFTPDRIQELLAGGARLRVVRRPARGWVTVCRIDADRRVRFDGDATDADDGDLLIEFGPVVEDPRTEPTEES